MGVAVMDLAQKDPEAAKEWLPSHKTLENPPASHSKK